MALFISERGFFISTIKMPAVSDAAAARKLDFLKGFGTYGIGP